MAKTQQDYLGANSIIDNNYVHLNIQDLIQMGNSEFLNKPDKTDFNAYVALIISALFKGALPNTDEDGYKIVDKTQAIVTDIRSSRISFATREEEKQVIQTFVFNVYSKDTTVFNPINVIGSTTEVNNAGEGIQF